MGKTNLCEANGFLSELSITIPYNQSPPPVSIEGAHFVTSDILWRCEVHEGWE